MYNNTNYHSKELCWQYDYYSLVKGLVDNVATT